MRNRGVMLLLSFTLSAGLPAAASPDNEPPTLDSFAWLEGEWQRVSRGSAVVESWRRVSETTMEGTAIRRSSGRSKVTEYLRLERMGDEIFYTAKPIENLLPTPFELIEWSPERFVFENPHHDFPQRIIYARRGDTGLVVRIEGATDGEERGIDFVFHRRE